MSASQSTSQPQQSEVQQCTRCGMVIPPTAAFCGKCGERVEKATQYTKDGASIDTHVDLERYRITSLMRRVPYVQLSLAIDIQQQRPVAIRDIDIHQIDMASRPRIFKALQQEYDLLRQQKSNDVLPLIASFHARDHLYSISAWPSTAHQQKSTDGQAPHIYTLQDLLQSGIGLPDEQIALNWILHLANAIEHLHRNRIVIGNLDPSTILVNQKDYSGQPTLFPSWMLPAVRSQMQQVLNTATASPLSLISGDRTAFFSPETKYGKPEMRSDIYSMGAILYLLVTGIAPTEQSTTTVPQLRSPREINPRVQNTLALTILKALSRDPAARFQSVNEFVAVLQQQQRQSKVSQRRTLLSQNRSIEKAGTQLAEINVTSDKKNKTEQDYVETNDNTTSIAPIPKQLARDDQPNINTHKLGQEPPNSDHEESIVEKGYLEQRMEPAKEATPLPQSENPTTVVEVALEPEDGTSVQNESDKTDLSSKDEENTDDQQLSHGTNIEDAPRDKTIVVDEQEDEKVPNESRVGLLESNEHVLVKETLKEQPLSNFSAAEVSAKVPPESEISSSSESNHADLSSSTLPSEGLPQEKRDLTAAIKLFSTLLEHVKRFVLGYKPGTNNAVAMIETPMRIQPNKNYTLRIHIRGRNEPKHASGPKQSNDTAGPGGLGSLIHGERVHIEVRSALYHNYAYIVQQTDVELPASNYAAEVTIPMRSITDSTGTKRERLHIFFTDEKHNPLYEKPFVVELFISNLVQAGQEGHNVLAIPL